MASLYAVLVRRGALKKADPKKSGDSGLAILKRVLDVLQQSANQ
jgi:hypothetical protein